MTLVCPSVPPVAAANNTPVSLQSEPAAAASGGAGEFSYIESPQLQLGTKPPPHLQAG